MKIAIHLFNQDFRIKNNKAFYSALEENDLVYPFYILDKKLLKSNYIGNSYINFLFESINELDLTLQKNHSKLIIRYGEIIDQLIILIKETGAKKVYFNRIYQAEFIFLEKIIISNLNKFNCQFIVNKGNVICSPNEILTIKKEPYKKFSNYYKSWQKKKNYNKIKNKLIKPFLNKLSTLKISSLKNLIPEDYGFVKQKLPLKSGESYANKYLISLSKEKSKITFISAYINIGNISVDKLLSKPFVNDDIERLVAFRDYNIQKYLANQYKYHKKLDIEFKSNFGSEFHLFMKWSQGKTGYPIIDAIMRKLNQESWLSYSERLKVADFLVNKLNINWELGCNYFFHKLLSVDLAQNIINWENCFKNSIIINQEEDKLIKKYLPELKHLPKDIIYTPNLMPESLQKKVKCIIGKDYPYPVI